MKAPSISRWSTSVKASVSPGSSADAGAGRTAGTSIQPATATRYGAQVLAHMVTPRGAGRLETPDGVGVAGSPACGDQVRIELQAYEGTITAARFLAFGCPATIAGASELVSRVDGKTILQAARVSEAELADALELSPAKRACSNLAADALHAALEDLVGRGLPLRPPDEPPDPRGVLIGMSGGVDSSLAAALLVAEGRSAVGVTFRFWSDPSCAAGGGCCSPETVVRARRAAHALGIPHLTVDLASPFYREVVEYFVREYEEGRTPNPCVRCNGGLRFAELVSLADRLGLAAVATGHYARIAGDPAVLHRGADVRKDQSYVLARVTPQILRRVLFPLGDLDKVQVRALAREARLEAHDAAESQEICFIPDDDHRRFLRERLGERPGDIVDREGRVLGRHTGVYNFTIGQRKGLRIAGPEPLFVAAVVPERCQVVAVPLRGLAVDTVLVTDLIWHASRAVDRGRVQLRSSAPAVETDVQYGEVEREGASLTLRLAEPVAGVAPGQTAVLYQGDAVVAAGTIVAARMEGETPVI